MPEILALFQNMVVLLLQAYIMLILLRFIMGLMRVDFHNPASRAIINFTNPPLRLLRALVPARGNWDLASLIMAYLLTLALRVMEGLNQWPAVLPTMLLNAGFDLLDFTLLIFLGALIGLVILSWIAPASPHPLVLLIYQITAPLLAPFRRWIPPVGGLDFSVMAALLLLYFTLNYLLPTLRLTIFENVGI